MAEKINDGGPAFPTIHGYVDSFGSLKQKSDGLSLRDWFAAKMLPRIGTGWPNEENRARLAKEAYEMADAMLLARQSATTVPQVGNSE